MFYAFPLVFLVMTESVLSIQNNGERNTRNAARNVGNSMREKSKSKHKFGGAEICKAEHVRKYFVNHQIENKVFGQSVNFIISGLDFRNTEADVCSCTSE